MPATRAGLLGLPLGIALQAANAAGDGLAMVALANRVFQSSQASWAVAAVFIAVTIPVSALAPLAGLMLDRLPARTVLLTAAAAESAIAAVLIWAPGLAMTLSLATGFGICAAVLQPGLSAMVPRLVDESALTRANSYLQAATWVGFTVGPLLAGLLITVSGSAAALAVDAILYALAAGGLAALRLAAVPVGSATAGTVPGSKPTFWAQMRAGFSYLRSDIDAGMLVVIVGITVAFGNMAVVAEVVFAEHVLHSGPGGYALLTAGWTAGMVIGTLAAGRLRRRWLLVGALTGTVLAGVGVALAGMAGALWQALAAYAAGGFANGAETVATRSFLGYRAPAEVANRVFALYSGIIFGGISVGMAVAAGLLPAIGARGVLLVSGSGAIIAGLAGCMFYVLGRHRAGARATSGIAGAIGDIR